MLCSGSIQSIRHLAAWAAVLTSIAIDLNHLAGASSAEIVLQRKAAIEVLAASYSPDGRLIAATGESDIIRLWDRESGDLVRTLPGHPERVVDVKFSPNGKLMASSSTDGSVKVWDYREGRLVHLLTNHLGNWVRRVAFSPDSRWLVPASYDGRVSVWDVASGSVVRTLSAGERVADVRFTPDGRFIVTATRDPKLPKIQFWDAISGEPGMTLTRSNYNAALGISPNGRFLAAAGGQGVIDFWELPSGRWLRRVQAAEKFEIRTVNFSPDSSRFVVNGKWVNSVFATDTGLLMFEMRGHEDGTFQASFSPDGSEIASASADASVRLWDSHSGKVRRIIEARLPDAPISSIAFSPDGKHEAVGDVSGAVRLWDAMDGSFQHDLRGHEGTVQAMTFSLDSRWLFTGGADRLMRTWDLTHGTISAHHPSFDRTDTMGLIVCGGLEQYIASASGPWQSVSGDFSIKIWQPHYDRPIRVLKGHSANVRALAYAPGKDLLASASAEGVVRMWNSREAVCLHSLTNEVLMETIAFTHDAKSVVAGMADGSVRFLDPATLATTRRWAAHQRPVQSLVLSADGHWLVTASADRTVAVWEGATGREVHRFTNVLSQYLPLAIHPQKPVLAFAQRDEMVVHADLTTGLVLLQRVLFPDGEWLAWNPSKAFYMGSPRGPQHARLRLADQLLPVYPLEFYRDELSRPTNLLVALAGPAPNLAPKNVQLWWHRYPHKSLWFYGVLAVVVILTTRALWRGVIAERRRQAQENFSRALLHSQEEERKRIAGELHDSLGQNLQIIKNRAALALKQAEVPAPLVTQLDEIANGATRAIAEVRAITHALRPGDLDQAGLTSAIVWLAEEMAQSSGLQIDHAVEPVDGLLSKDDEVNLFRIIQEALNNVVKHAAATTVTLELKRSVNTLQLSVFDNGRGFPMSARSKSATRKLGGLGVPGMQERARLLGGQADLHSTEGHGTRLTVMIRIPEPTASR